MSVDYEIIDLASEGWFYDKDHPFSCGTAKLKHLCFNVEKKLCSPTIKRRGLSDNIFLESVLEYPLTTTDILDCDYQTILLNSKILNYGSISKYKIECPFCGVSSEQEIKFNFSGKPTPRPVNIGQNLVKYTLPSGDIVNMKIPTVEEARMESQSGWLEFLKILIVSGPFEDINVWIDSGELSIRDSRAIRDFFRTSYPGFNNEVDLLCDKCGEKFKTSVEFNLDIMGFSPEYKKVTQSEIFQLAYHTNGAFDAKCIESMSVIDRTFYLNELVEQRKREEAASRKTTDGKSSTIAPPPIPKR
jgi:hypothetical protein